MVIFVFKKYKKIISESFKILYRSLKVKSIGQFIYQLAIYLKIGVSEDFKIKFISL